MASIERTAYPRLKKNLTGVELWDYYSPSLEETFFVRENARGDEPQPHLLVQLKTFQRLGYFPSIEDVSEKLLRHLRQELSLPNNILPLVIPRTLYRHQAAVRKYLNVKNYDKTARKLVVKAVFDRKHFEVCAFSHLAQELKSGDIAIAGSEEYGDYRDGLLSWAECELLVAEFCQAGALPSNAIEFVRKLKDELSAVAEEIDRGYPLNSSLTLDEKGELVLKKMEKQETTARALALESAVVERMPERNLLDVIANAQFHTNWMRHFGPLSGSDPKLDRPVERYLLTLFTYGCNLGPAQAARHMRGLVSGHMLSFVNRRHVDAKKLDAALVDLLDDYHKFRLPKFWGDGTKAAADGTKYDLSEQNLMAEYHIRYGGYGGIAYHHVSDLYVALFSHFISCGTWEAVYIIDGLLKNKSEIGVRPRYGQK